MPKKLFPSIPSLCPFLSRHVMPIALPSLEGMLVPQRESIKRTAVMKRIIVKLSILKSSSALKFYKSCITVKS